MNAQQAPALRAFPPLLLPPDKRLQAAGLNHAEVFDHAHPVLRSVPLIQLLNPGAGKNIAGETKRAPGIRKMTAVLDPADSTVLRLGIIRPVTSCAWIAVPDITDAQGAVHAAGSDHGSVDMDTHRKVLCINCKKPGKKKL